MSAITLPFSPESGKMRPLNIMHDLAKVADLMALCFQHNMDSDGQRYVQQMRDASKNRNFLSWASNSLPLSGYIWEDQKNIVGNISVIPFRKSGKNTFLLANIAVHPDYRRKGIARLLTQKGIEYARQRNAASIWLQVEEENLGAINLYQNLGFQTRARRTSWVGKSGSSLPQKAKITSPSAHLWREENHWLEKKYPKEIRWYRMPDWENFKPGLKYWLYKIFIETDIRHFSIEKDGKFQAALIWTQTFARRSHLWLASAPQTDDATLTSLLLHLRSQLSSASKELHLDYPAGEFVEAFEAAGFTPRRTLLWMRVTE